MAGTSVQLLGIEQGNGTMLSQSYDTSPAVSVPVS